MLSLDVTRHPNLMGLENENLSKKFRDSSHFRDLAKTFYSSATPEEIIAVGEQLLVSIYNGIPGETLNFVRYKYFCEKVAWSISHIQPQTLPPTSAAAKYDSLRVYYQVQQWKRTGDDLLPDEWGCIEREWRNTCPSYQWFVRSTWWSPVYHSM